MSKLKIERKPKRGDRYRVSWDDRWGRYQFRKFDNKAAKARAACFWLTVKDFRYARWEGWEDGKHVHIAGADDRYAVSRDGKPQRKTVTQGRLWEGEG